MPKYRKTGHLTRVASRQTPITKIISCSFESQTYQIPISRHDDAITIFHAFSRAVDSTNIRILDDKGIKLQLGYAHIKANGRVLVQRLEGSAQNHLVTGQAPQKVRAMLVNIMADWEVKLITNILPLDCAPKEKSFDGDRATYFDTNVRLTHPRAWTAAFTEALQQLSSRTKERQDQAIEMLRDARNTRHQDKKDKQWGAWETMTKDILNVVAKLNDKAENLELAADAVNVVESKMWKGELDDAIERVEEGTDIEGREEDSTATHHVLAMR